MPEGPEVQRVVDSLIPHLIQKSITEVTVSKKVKDGKNNNKETIIKDQSIDYFVDSMNCCPLGF